MYLILFESNIAFIYSKKLNTMKRKYPNAIVFFSFIYLYCSHLVFGQIPTKVYANAVQSNHEQGVWARAMVTDPSGNVYVTGLFHGTCDFDASTSGVTQLVYQGGTVNDVDGESDVYIAKYDLNGALVWAKSLIEPTFGGMNEERASAMTIDDDNNLYLTGFTNTRGFFISKWDDNGNEIWTRYFDDVEANSVISFGIKPNSNGIVVAGLFRETVDFDPSPTAVNTLTAINSDGFLLSLNSDGLFQWVKHIQTNGVVFITGIDTNAADEIITSGAFLGTVDFNPDPSIQSLQTSLSVSAGAISSGFVAKYNAQGNFLWVKHYRGSSTTDFLTTLIQKDANDNFIICGSYKGLVQFSSTTIVSSTTNYNSFLSKIDADGNLLWAKKVVSTDGFLQISSCANLALDNCGNAYISGEFTGTCDFDPGVEIHQLQSLTNTRAVYVAKYSPEGNYDWAFDIKGVGFPDFAELNGHLPMVIDKDQKLVIAGSFRGTMDFDPSAAVFNVSATSVLNSNIAGVFLAKYENANTCLLGTSHFQKNDFMMYPNPASNTVNLAFEVRQNQVKIEFIDVQGRLILQQNNDFGNQFTVDIRSLPKGMYFVKIDTDTSSYYQKLIVN